MLLNSSHPPGGLCGFGGRGGVSLIKPGLNVDTSGKTGQSAIFICLFVCFISRTLLHSASRGGWGCFFNDHSGNEGQLQ